MGEPRHLKQEFIQNIHRLWVQPPADSRVVLKWKGRTESLGGALPFAPSRLRFDGTPPPRDAFQTPRRSKGPATLSRVHSHVKEPEPSSRFGLSRAHVSPSASLDEGATKPASAGKSLKDFAMLSLSKTTDHKSSSTVESRMSCSASSSAANVVTPTAKNEPNTQSVVATVHPVTLVKAEPTARWRTPSAREARKRIGSDEVVCPARKKPAGQDNRVIGMEGELTSGAMDAEAAGQPLEDQASSTSDVKTTNALEVRHVANLGSEVPSACMMTMPSAGRIHGAGGVTSKLHPVAAAVAMCTEVASGPSDGAARSSHMASGQVASALLQEATPMDDSGAQRVRRRLRLASPGPTPCGSFSISGSGGSGSSGAGLAAHERKPKRIRILGVPPLDERQAASLNTSITDAKETAKEATEAAQPAIAAIASTAPPGQNTRPRWRSLDCRPLPGEAVPQQRKQVLHASLSPNRRNSQVLRMPTGEPVFKALRKAVGVATNPSGMAQASTPAAPTAEAQDCLPSLRREAVRPHPALQAQVPLDHGTRLQGAAREATTAGPGGQESSSSSRHREPSPRPLRRRLRPAMNTEPYTSFPSMHGMLGHTIETELLSKMVKKPCWSNFGRSSESNESRIS